MGWFILPHLFRKRSRKTRNKRKSIRNKTSRRNKTTIRKLKGG